MKSQSKFILISVVVALLIGLVVGIGSTSRYYWCRTTTQADTVFVERIIKVNTSEAERVQLPSAGTVSIPKESISFSDSSIIAIKKDSVLVSGIEPISGATYEAVVTGVRPDLNNLRITVPEYIVTRSVTKPQAGWSLGLFADTYYFKQLDVRAGLYASYTAGPFCIHLDAGAMYSNIGPIKTVNPFIGAGIKIQLYHKQ